MSLQSTYDEQVSTMATMLAQQVGSLDDATLAKRPGPALNPIGFIQWHILRIWDLDLNLLIKGGTPETDAWHRGGYDEEIGYEPIGIGPGGTGLGFGYTDAEVDAVPYRADVLSRYQQQLVDETKSYLAGATNEDLQRAFELRGEPTSVAGRLQHVVAHSWNHIGEIRLTKGLLGYPDPTTPPRS